jgi:hypothetical protein
MISATSVEPKLSEKHVEINSELGFDDDDEYLTTTAVNKQLVTTYPKRCCLRN